MTPSGLHAACRPPSPPPSSSSSSSSAAAAATAPYCRVCFDGADDFVISPCKCTGTGAFIHKACLRRWQRVALASGNPERAHACGVCKAPYMQCYRLGRENAVRWAKNRSMADSEGQRQGGEEEDDEGKEGQVDGWLGRAAALLSPGCVVKSATLFALALVIPYAVLAYYGIMTLSYVDPLHCDGVGSGSAAQEALRRREREAAAAAVAPGRTVLVASSRIARGSVFSKSIVLLLEHNVAWGSRGVIVNKALAAPFRREHPHLRADAEGTLLGSFSSASPCVLLGGPVEPSVVTVLHREAGGGGQAVAPGLFMATTEQEEAEGSSEVARLLRRLREGGGSSNGASGACRTFVGYAGWSAGQLQEEVKRGDWHVFDADPEAVAELLFDLILDDDRLLSSSSADISSIPSEQGGEEEEEEEKEEENREAPVEDEGMLLWRELVGCLGEDVDESEEEDGE